jgi:hypothetical protein
MENGEIFHPQQGRESPCQTVRRGPEVGAEERLGKIENYSAHTDSTYTA